MCNLPISISLPSQLSPRQRSNSIKICTHLLRDIPCSLNLKGAQNGLFISSTNDCVVWSFQNSYAYFESVCSCVSSNLPSVQTYTTPRPPGICVTRCIRHKIGPTATSGCWIQWSWNVSFQITLARLQFGNHKEEGKGKTESSVQMSAWMRKNVLFKGAASANAAVIIGQDALMHHSQKTLFLSRMIL